MLLTILREKQPVRLLSFHMKDMVYEINILPSTRSNQKPYYYHHRQTTKCSRMLLIIEVGDIAVLW